MLMACAETKDDQIREKYALQDNFASYQRGSTTAQQSFHFFFERREESKSKPGLCPSFSSSAVMELVVRKRVAKVTTESWFKRAQLCTVHKCTREKLRSPQTAPLRATGFTNHYRSSTKSLAPWEKRRGWSLSVLS